MKLLAAVGVALVAGAVLAIPATDDFNRADGAVGATWVTQSANAMQIAFNQIESSTAGPDSECMRWNPATDTFSANQSSQVTITSHASDSVAGVTVRASGTDGAGTFTAYLLNARGNFAGDTDIAAITPGVYTVILDLAPTTWTAGDTMKLDASGTTITAYKNGAAIGSVVNGAIATGQPGICVYGYPFGERMDDWSGDNVGGATPPATSGRFLLLGVGHP